MSSFKNIAYQILKEAGKPLHSEEITARAKRKGLLKSQGKTPAATMNSQLVVDTNKKKRKSCFVKVGPSVFAINKLVNTPNVGVGPKKLQKIVSEDFVKNAVIKWLSSNGWGHFEFGKLHDHGPDIKARNHRCSRYYYVEAKGGKYDEVGFVYSLGQIITRMKAGKSTRNYYGLALSQGSAKIALRRLPWQVAKKLLLCVFSVEDSGYVTQYSWKELKKLQK